MRLLYSGENIVAAVYTKDWFADAPSTDGFSVFEIDEVGEINKVVCADLHRISARIDAAGKSKYYVEGDKLYVRDNWTPTTPFSIRDLTS
jgi:hypothetical protein